MIGGDERKRKITVTSLKRLYITTGKKLHVRLECYGKSKQAQGGCDSTLEDFIHKTR